MKEIRVYFIEKDNKQYHLDFKLPENTKEIPLVELVESSPKSGRKVLQRLNY